MDEKQKLRLEIWRKMEEYEIATYPRPCYGKIPNFVGSMTAASRISRLPIFRQASVIYVNSEAAQRPLRELALRYRKTLIMAIPGLTRGFIILEPDRVKGREGYASTLRGALSLGRRVRILENIKADLYVVGSVAVDEKGGRLGRGNGFGDLEYALLRELKVIDGDTPVVTTVHDVQVVEHVPMEPYDVPVDYIATPTRLIRVKPHYKKPPGIIWDILSLEFVNSIPILKVLAGL